MSKILRFLIVIGVVALPYPANSQTNIPIPDFTGWIVSKVSRIELKISDCASVYLGNETEYINPEDSMEFGWVASRHIPIPVYKCKKQDERSSIQAAVSIYTQREEREFLEKHSKDTDPFLYVRWHIQKDPITGQDIIYGDTDIWIMLHNGRWFRTKNEDIEYGFLTENLNAGGFGNIPSGKKYKVGRSYHTLMVFRDDIVQILKETGD